MIGRKYESWIDGRNSAEGEACPVQRCTRRTRFYHKMEIETQSISDLPNHILTLGETYQEFETDGSFTRYFIRTRAPPTRDCWLGTVTPTSLYIEAIHREDGLYMSDITHAVFNMSYDIDLLERVFLVNVQNADTENFITQELYDQWPDDEYGAETKTFAHGTPGYQALLGTPFGKFVACLVLGSFPRGTRRISRILTWQNTTHPEPQMRFDIEPTPAQTQAPAQTQSKKRKGSDEPALPPAGKKQKAAFPKGKQVLYLPR